MTSKSIRTLLIDKYKTKNELLDSDLRIIDRIPEQLLGTKTHKKLQKSINKYNYINKIFQDNKSDIDRRIINIIKTVIYTELERLKTVGRINTYDYCIGGSIAWNKIFQKHYQEQDLMSDYEKSAIHDNSIDLYNYISSINDELLNHLFNLINEAIVKLKRDYIDIAIIQKLTLVKISSKIFKIFIIENYYGNELECELTNIYFYNINPTETINLINLKDENNYLNIYGLYIYNYISKNTRKPVKNNYDIYNVREQLFDKYILINEPLRVIESYFIDNIKLKILFYLLYSYQETFKDAGNYIYDKYFIKNIKKKFFNESDIFKTFDNLLKYYLIEQFRPYINYTINLINFELDRCGFPNLFVVGGDCCRRYKNDLSKTEDIDTKLYVTNEDDFKEVEEIIIEKINKLIAFLIVNKDRIINKTKLLKYFIDKGYTDENIKFDDNGNLLFIYYDIDANKKVKYELTYYLNDDYSTFFRFRHIFSTIFPVDLYASDFQIKSNCKIYKINDDYQTFELLYEDNELTFDMAYLDISVDIIKLGEERLRQERTSVLSNNLLIARLLFLIKDIIKTYNTDESSIMRLINGKSRKDYLRYIELVKIFKSYLFIEKQIISTDKYILEENNFEGIREEISEEDKEFILSLQIKNNEERKKLDVSTDIGTQISTDELIKQYYTYFINEYKQRRERNKEKVFFTFDLNTLNTNSEKYSIKGKNVKAAKGSSRSSRSSKKGGKGETILEPKIRQLRTSSISRTSSMRNEIIKENIKKNIERLKTIYFKEMINEKEDIEFAKLEKSKEFKMIDNIINKKKSKNKKILKTLFNNINFTLLNK